MMTPQQIKEKFFIDHTVVYVKFVKVAGKYRFAPIDEPPYLEHWQMVFGEEKAESAGTIKLYPQKKTWEYENWSMSLKLGLDEEDYIQLGEIFGLENK